MDAFERTTVEMHGATGRDWLERLPAAIAACEKRWSLRVEAPFSHLTFNYVAPAMRDDGVAVVLKICGPTGEFRSEADALRFFDGHGCARLLDVDVEESVLLLERLEPGTPLLAVADDEEATAIAARTMRALWRAAPPDHRFPTVADWAAGFGRLRQHFNGGSGPLPQRIVDRAERLFADLLASMGEPVVLHGDLHHDNIRAARREPWLAIDPKGIVGEREYETGSWLRNWQPDLLSTPHPGRILERRIHQFAGELNFDAERIRSWAVAQAVLSAWWTIEDRGHNWDGAIACAELLAAITL
ncbi:MAG: aminoglycoside phosphotransferase family protein [Chloroflexota bacterium]